MILTLFRSETVRRYLLGGARFVATIRDCNYYRARVGRPVTLDLGEKKLRGKVIKVEDLGRADKYVSISGFRSTEEWLSEAKRLHKRDDLSGLCIVIVEVFPDTRQHISFLL